MTCGKLAQQRRHAVVVLQGVHAHPWEDVLARREIFVVRLVHVPEDGDVGHVCIVGCVISSKRFRMLRILDRYVLREVIAPFLLALLLLTFALEIPPIIDRAKRSSPKGASWGIVARVLADAVAAGARHHDPDGAAWSASSSRSAGCPATARSSRWKPAASASARLLRPLLLFASLATASRRTS